VVDPEQRRLVGIDVGIASEHTAGVRTAGRSRRVSAAGVPDGAVVVRGVGGRIGRSGGEDAIGGESDRKGQPMSKAGNRLLRVTLIRAADHARREDPQLTKT